MVKHVVMWTLKNKADALKLKAIMEDMKGKVPSLLDIECGINYNSSDAACDLILISVHNSKEDLNTYQKDPIHLEVGKIIKAAVTAKNVVDFEF